MLLGVAGPGGQFPRPVPVPHIIQGVLGIRFAPLLLYLQHAGFSTIFARFCRFSPIFAPFSVFLAPWPHLPGGTRSRKTEPGRREPQTPWVGARKTTHRAGSQAAHSTAQGRGTAYRPHPRGGAPPSARGGGPAAAGPREGGETGARGQQQAAGQHSGAGGQRPGGHRAAREPPTDHRPRRRRAERGTNGSRKRRFAPAAYRRCFVRLCRRSKRAGCTTPPRARNRPGQNYNAAPRRGGPAPARPHVAGL